MDNAIRSRGREPVNHVNRVCEQDAMGKIVILLICCAKTNKQNTVVYQ